MKRAMCLFVLVSVLGFANRAWAEEPEDGASPVFFVQFNVSVGPSLPAGSIILCKAELVRGSSQLDESDEPTLAYASRADDQRDGPARLRCGVRSGDSIFLGRQC